MSIRGGVWAVTLAALLVSPALSAGQQPGGFSVVISYYIRADGTGMLIANPSPYGQGSVSWSACRDGGDACSPISSPGQGDRVLDVGDAAPGTVFVATAVDGAQIASARSVPYGGAVRSTALPAIGGKLEVGALIEPIAGGWNGGWGSEVSYLQTQVCKTASGSGCRVIADAGYWNVCPGAGAVLTRADQGLYVRVIDERISADMPFAAYAITTPSALSPIQPGPDAAARIDGPIAPSSQPPQSDCGQPRPLPGPPIASLALRPAWRHGRLALGHIRCPSRCRPVVTVGQSSRRLHRIYTFASSAQPRTLWWPASLATRLRRGPAVVSVRIGGRTISKRHVMLPGHPAHG